MGLLNTQLTVRSRSVEINFIVDMGSAELWIVELLSKWSMIHLLLQRNKDLINAENSRLYGSLKLILRKETSFNLSESTVFDNL